MRGREKTGRARAGVAAGPDEDVYGRYAADLYRQAMLTLGDGAQAEQVVCDVLARERALPRGPRRAEEDTRRRLAEAALRCCQELAAASALGGAVSGGTAPGDPLSGQERAALGLVLYGGLSYAQAGAVLGIGPRDMAILLRSALHRIGPSYAAQER